MVGFENFDFCIDVWVDYVDREEIDGDGFVCIMWIVIGGVEVNDFVIDLDGFIGVDVGVFCIDFEGVEFVSWVLGFLCFGCGVVDEVGVFFEWDKVVEFCFGCGVVGWEFVKLRVEGFV